MGQFESGKWVIGLSLYFFVFFLIMTSVINTSDELNIDRGDLYVADSGFQTVLTPFDSGTCVGKISRFKLNYCSSYDSLDSNGTCSLIDGCTWSEGWFSEYCEGNPSPSVIPTTDCSYISNQTICEVLENDGCTWLDKTDIETIDPSQSYSNGGLVTSIKFLFGFNARLGIPATYRFIIIFLFFWIPFMALLWAIYMSAPFLH